MKALFSIHIAFLFAVFAGKAVAQSSDSDWSYTLNESNQATVYWYTGAGGVVTIPASLDGFPVNSISRIGGEGVGLITSLSIPSSVSSIEPIAFILCSSMASITIPNSVTNVGNFAFRGCGQLKSVSIPNSTAVVGYGAFQDCTNLTSVALPGSLTSIAGELFAGCISLNNVIIPSSATSIGASAFKNCKSLSFITVPNSVTNIGNFAFHGCSNLASINLGSGLLVIGDAVFANCTSLADIALPQTLTSIGSGVFTGSSIRNLNIPNSVTNLSPGAFSQSMFLTNAVIGNGVTTVPFNAFYGSTNLRSVRIGSSVTNIDQYAFYECLSLQNLLLPDSLQTIGTAAFYRCEALKLLQFGSNLASVGVAAFNKCVALENLQFGTNSVFIDSMAFAECAQLTNVIIPRGVIGNSAFAGIYGGSHKLAQVTLGDGVTEIGDNAFGNCNTLESIVIPASVKRIGVGAFIYCASLKNATVGFGVTNISDSAFKLCPNLRSVLFTGNAPSTVGSGIFDFSVPTVYYYANTSGWTSSFAGRPTVALAGSSYTNSLTNQNSLTTDFGYLQVGAAGALSANADGITLTTSSSEFAAGYWLKRNLSSAQNWTATVKCHVSEFSANQSNPWFYGALALVKNGFTQQDITDNPIVELKLVRTGENGLTNSVSWKNNSKDYTFYQDKLVPKDGVTDLFLSFSYVAENTTLSANISGNGVVFTNLTKWNLGEVWDVTLGDVFTVVVGAGHQPYGGASATHQIQQGDIYLRDLNVSFDTNSGSPSSDTDADGLNDLAEQSLAGLGFNWRVPQPQLVTSFMAHAPTAGLFTQAQYDANRIAGISEGRAQVTGNPAGYGLYTSNSIMDLRMGGLMIQKQGNNAVISFQPQTTPDLAAQPFTNSGTPITNIISMPGNKGFIRIKAN